MPQHAKPKSAQLGTYVTMIVGLLFLFLVVSQAGKYSKDGFVVTQLREQMDESGKKKPALLNDRERTLMNSARNPPSRNRIH